MPRKAEELGALAVSRLREPGLHMVGGVDGLGLRVATTGGRSWVFREMMGARRREMGLGGYPDVTLAKARELAREARDLLRRGCDPIETARGARLQLRQAPAIAMTFRDAAVAYIAAHESSWRNAKHREQWRVSLEQYAFPVLASLSVDAVELAHVMRVLEPIWHAKTETAKRLRGRIEAVLDWASAMEYRTGSNPARWRGHLDKLLAKPSRIRAVAHRRALPIDQVPGFMARLSQVEGMGARALEFVILTAARSGEVRGATWREFDLELGLWVVPSRRMKSGRVHRVPLSQPATDLLRFLGRGGPDDLVFTSSVGSPLSDMTISSVLKRMCVDAVPHGFRSTFRDWAAERTHYANEVAEMALAHTVGSQVEAAYRRGDLFEKRRGLMTDWAEFCLGGEGRLPGNGSGFAATGHETYYQEKKRVS